MWSGVLTVGALWDQEAGVWVATSDDVPGLASEADTMEQLVAKLQVMVPELLELNGTAPDDAKAPIELMARLPQGDHRRA